MRETIRQLRKFILDTLPDNVSQGFSQKVPVGSQAQPAGGSTAAWSSLLFRNGTVDIWLKFEQSVKYKDNTQTLTLHGEQFRAVRLILVDWEKTAKFDIRIRGRRQVLFDRVGAHLPTEQGQRVYETENAVRADFNINGSVGHVLTLHIKKVPRTNWTIGANLNREQLENASANLVAKVSAALNDLLPAAQYYVNNRPGLLSKPA